MGAASVVSMLLLLPCYPPLVLEARGAVAVVAATVVAATAVAVAAVAAEEKERIIADMIGRSACKMKLRFRQCHHHLLPLLRLLIHRHVL